MLSFYLIHWYREVYMMFLSCSASICTCHGGSTRNFLHQITLHPLRYNVSHLARLSFKYQQTGVGWRLGGGGGVLYERWWPSSLTCRTCTKEGNTEKDRWEEKRGETSGEVEREDERTRESAGWQSQMQMAFMLITVICFFMPIRTCPWQSQGASSQPALLITVRRSFIWQTFIYSFNFLSFMRVPLSLHARRTWMYNIQAGMHCIFLKGKYEMLMSA